VLYRKGWFTSHHRRWIHLFPGLPFLGTGYTLFLTSLSPVV
jgi:hypothetical protein